MKYALLLLAALGVGTTATQSFAQVSINGSYSSAACGGGTGTPIIICGTGTATTTHSYILTSNLTASTTDAIDITGDNVTLDLNGYTVSGSGGVCNASSGG